jgi:Leucine-rich repeat (LRR) protein
MAWIDLVERIESYPFRQDCESFRMESIKKLTQLDLGATPITDAGLKVIGRMSNLKCLRLGDTQITDAGLAEIRGLKSLTFLGLDSTRISDAGLKHVKELQSLAWLYLGSTDVMDAGLNDLDAGTSALQLALPNCKIVR